MQLKPALLFAMAFLGLGCSASNDGGGSIRIAATGEALAQTGYAFPPRSPDDPALVDGWEVEFDRVLVTLDRITLSENPDGAPGDPSKTGKIVAEADGPWAVDLHRSDPGYLPGKGGKGEQAVPLTTIANQNKNGGASLASDTRYAFGYDVVPASAGAKIVNLDAAGEADYVAMVGEGCTVLYAGTATFRGDKTDAACFPDDRKTFPDTVHFRFCFKSPTSYVNCQNPDNDPAQPFAGEEHQRGIQIAENKTVVGQITIHTDHPFWDSVIHDSPAHFDQFAARAVGKGAEATVTLDDIVGVDYTAYSDASGARLDWRYCMEPPSDAHPKLTGAMAFQPGSVPFAASDDAKTGLRDYYDFATYDQSTQGHLNSDGLCFVRRNYDSPP